MPGWAHSLAVPQAGAPVCLHPPPPFSLWDFTHHLFIHLLTWHVFIELLLCGPRGYVGEQDAITGNGRCCTSDQSNENLMTLVVRAMRGKYRVLSLGQPGWPFGGSGG